MRVRSDDLVSDVMNGWPATIRVFLEFQDGVRWLSYRVLSHRG
jgi:hypothetical protein